MSFASLLLRTLALATLVLLAAPAHALDGPKSNPALDEDDADIESKYLDKIQLDAATYIIGRTHFTSDPDYERRGAEYLAEAKEILATGRSQPDESGYAFLFGRTKRARRLADAGFERYPYSAVSGDLLAFVNSCYAKTGDITGVHGTVFKLWFYQPDYPRMTAVLEEALAAAEREQDFSALVDLEAEDPDEVIRLGGSAFSSDINKLFRFLLVHGDRETIAPRAQVGLARALLRTKDKQELSQARREYEKFLETYPTHDLVFTVLCEQALSYLVAYKGNHYDVGVLFNAANIIDQAEVEAHADPKRIATVEAYRKRIRSWHQDRDLEVARWYRGMADPATGWLRSPGTADPPWHDAARYYFVQTIKRDSGSNQARQAQAEVDTLPAPQANPLGTPLPLAPAK
jgi:tetratricopeptide (TPR) repeat protein